jgi:hypothetical protein
MPALLLFSDEYLRGRPRQRAGIQFTEGGPNQPTLAPNSYLVRNFREGPLGAGRVMGGGPLLDGSLVCFSNATGVLRNFKDGKSGFDDDYLLMVRWWGRGWISSSFGEGPGWVVGLTDVGIVACDGEEWLLLSEGLYKQSRESGSLAYEIGECRKAQAQDNHGDYFHCCVDRGRIWISYRSSAAVSRPDRFHFLDFTPGRAQQGLSALVDDRQTIDGQPNPGFGRPFGWSPPFVPADTLTDDEVQGAIAPGAMGAFRDSVSGATLLVGTRDRHQATAGVEEGHVWQLDTGVLDGATAYGPLLFTRTHATPVGTLRQEPKMVVVRYHDLDGVLTVHHARTAQAHLANPAHFTGQLMPASVSAEPFKDFEWDLPLVARGQAKAVEIKITAGSSGSNRPEVFGLLYRFELAETKE